MWGGVEGGGEVCDECSWIQGLRGVARVGSQRFVGVLRCTLSGWGGGWGEIVGGGEFKSQCLVEGWGRARTGGEHDHLD